jgi:hypothetical protein
LLSSYWSQQKNNEFGIADKLNNTKKILVSTTIKEAKWGETIIVDKDVIQQIKHIRDQIEGNIDELRLLIHPFIAGTGKRVFEVGLHIPVALKHEMTMNNGVVLLIYNS